MNTTMKENSCYLGIDIGGTWIKACRDTAEIIHCPNDKVITDSDAKNHTRIKSSLNKETTISDFIELIQKVIENLEIDGWKISGIGISTAGIVDYAGTKVLKAALHLNVLKNQMWKKILEDQFQCKAVVINDADAAAIGLAELGYLKGNKTIGIMPIGTGLGFTVWRNGRRWQPGKALTLLGSIKLPEGNFDFIASASRLAALNISNNLLQVLTNSEYKDELELYIQNLVKVINTAAIIYSLDEVIICGGLADAANECNYALGEQLNKFLSIYPEELDKAVKVIVANEGNQLQLIGVLALAKGEVIAGKNKVNTEYNAIETEVPNNEKIHLEKLDSYEIVETFWEAEQEAAIKLKESLPLLSKIVDEAVKKIQSGGRIIYVGAGTSGRIAAMDSVEIPCTYGFPEDRIITLISGGISDAAIEIESNYEEDASAVPEMLLLNIKAEDIIIGISASGTAYYVQSALAFAKNRGALTILLQVNLPEKELQYCDYIIPLNSGMEVVAGSTRMKAGTATKKILNFLSSAIMIKLGKVVGSYMVNMVCLNNKLVERATNILNILFGIDKEEAYQKLKDAEMNLSIAIDNITNKNHAK